MIQHRHTQFYHTNGMMQSKTQEKNPDRQRTPNTKAHLPPMARRRQEQVFPHQTIKPPSKKLRATQETWPVMVMKECGMPMSIVKKTESTKLFTFSQPPTSHHPPSLSLSRQSKVTCSRHQCSKSSSQCSQVKMQKL